MKIGKWNYETKSYDEYELPVGAKIYAEDDVVVSCAGCGEKMVYGDGFCRLEIHTNMGFGYQVCADCYLKEWKRRKKEETKRKKNENNI